MLRPSDIDGTLPIKFWEIEVSDDPQEKWWAGCVLIRADRIRRPIPEGTELELTVKIDASRKMTVEVFIPLLNQSFSHEVYVPDPPGSRSHLQQEVDHCFDRLELIREEMYATDRADLGERVQALTERAEMIAEQIASSAKRNADDPDASLGSTDALRKLRIQLVQVEEQLNIGSAAPTLMRKMRWQVPYIGRVIEMHGTEPEKTEFARLRGQYERYLESDDVRGIKWVQEQIWRLHNMVVDDQPWFWMSILATLKSPGTRFMNQEQAQRFIHDAENAQARGDLRALRDACNRAWVLQPPEQMETTRQQAAQSGLRAQ
jgi:molecular chaperone DnaK